MFFRGNPDLHDPTGRGHRLNHGRWLRPGRQGGCRRLQAFLHQLTRVDFVGPGLEEEDNDRQVGNRAGPHDLKSRHAVQCLLQRDGDQFLHLHRRKPEAAGLNFNLGRRELWKDIDRHAADLRHPVNHQHGCESHHQESKPQGCRNNPVQHKRFPCPIFQPQTRCRIVRLLRLSPRPRRRMGHQPEEPRLP